MTKEAKIMMLSDKRNRAMAKLNEIYDNNYASADITAKDTLKLNMWYEKKKRKIEKKYIKCLMKL